MVGTSRSEPPMSGLVFHSVVCQSYMLWTLQSLMSKERICLQITLDSFWLCQLEINVSQAELEWNCSAATWACSFISFPPGGACPAPSAVWGSPSWGWSAAASSHVPRRPPASCPRRSWGRRGRAWLSDSAPSRSAPAVCLEEQQQQQWLKAPEIKSNVLCNWQIWAQK